MGRPYTTIHVVLLCKVKTAKSYIGLSSGQKMIKAQFDNEEGEQQGAVESMQLFTLGTDDANVETNTELREHGGALVAGADDTYIIAPPAVEFVALRRHKDRMMLAGLKLNVAKTKAYIHRDFRNASYHEYRGDIPEGHVIGANGVKAYGIKVYGIPVGSTRYIKTILEQQASRIEKNILTTKETWTQSKPQHLNYQADNVAGNLHFDAYNTWAITGRDTFLQV